MDDSYVLLIEDNQNRAAGIEKELPDQAKLSVIGDARNALHNEHYFETYLRESTEGPPRKYYHLTAAGVLYRDNLESEWDLFQQQVNRFLKEQRT